MSPDILYNCCTNAAEPDWTVYDAIELGGCIMDRDDDGYVTGGIDRENAEFFTAYGHLKVGGCEAITDWHGSFEEAVTTAQELSRISGLPLHIHC